MRRFQIVILLLFAFLFVTCSESTETFKDTEDIKNYELALYFLEKDNLVNYENCVTFKDSTIAEAEMISYYLSYIGKEKAFNKISYSDTYDTVVENRIGYYKQTGISLLGIAIFIYLIMIIYLNTSNNLKKIKKLELIAGSFLLVSAIMAFTSFTLFSLEEVVTKVWDFKDVVNFEYFFNNSS